MSVQLITRPTDSINPPADAGLFVIFEIAGGCKCCARSPRETVLPEGWGSRSGMSLRELLAFPHGVDRPSFGRPSPEVRCSTPLDKLKGGCVF
jgi:hypothetical protein